MTDNDDKILVKYEGNADPGNATAAITFLADPDRRDIAIGGIGELTQGELSNLQGLGYRLSVVEDDLKGLNKDKLQAKAAEEGVSINDPNGDELKVEDLKSAIWASRASRSADVEELPASATVGGAPPVASGAGSAAGPGGAAGSGDAGGGPATTGTATTGAGA